MCTAKANALQMDAVFSIGYRHGCETQRAICPIPDSAGQNVAFLGEV
jgi:hypothetical protein